MHEVVPGALAGERIDRVVAMLAGVSRGGAASLIGAGAVQIDGAPVTASSTRVRAGQELDIEIPAEEGGAELVGDPTVVFTAVHEDDQVIVVDKPVGLVVHPGAGHRSGTLVHGLLARYPEIAGVGQAGRPGIVHRLDKDTSGLLVVARTQDAYRSLVAQLADHSAGRAYLALVWGVPSAPVGVVDAPLGRSQRRRTTMAVRAEGRPARTRYALVHAYRHPVACALLECALETGRTHQIRVHLSSIGHPVVGDREYRGVRANLVVPRPMLHAAGLSFDHPATGARLSLTSAVPADMAQVLARLEA